jgi:hypothetical protein
MDKYSIEVINNLGNRLQALTGGIDYRIDDCALDSPDQLIAMCAYNSRECKKIDALDEEHQQRIWSLIASILAVALQEEAIQKYGNTDGSSIRQVLDAWFNRPEYQVFLEKLRQTTKLSLLNFNLTEQQIDAVIEDMFDKLPRLMMGVVEKLTIPLRFFPQVEAHSIGMTLADMIREVEA